MELSEALRIQGEMVERSRPIVEMWSSMPVEALARHGYRSDTEGGAKFLNFLEGIKGHDDFDTQWRRHTTAVLLENARLELSRMDETVKMQQVGGFEKLIFPTISAVQANLILNDLVSIQPMTAPTGLVFYLDVLAGTTKGKISKGDRLYGSTRGPEPIVHYTDEVVDTETLVIADGTNYGGGGTALAVSVSYIPVRPGTVNITDGTQNVSDDGNGNLVGNCSSGTINYQTGAIANFKFTSVTAASTPITASYEFDSELTDLVPEMDIRLTSSNITAKTNKLKIQYSMEASQDLRQLHGLDVEPTIMAYTTNEIQREIVNRVRDHLIAVAAAGSVTWNRTPPTGVQWYFHKQQVRDTLIEGSGLIRKATRRFAASWLMCDVTTCSILKVVDGFKPAPKPSGIAGVWKVGTLDNMDIYEDPDFPVSKVSSAGSTTGAGIFGHKGGTFIESGYVFAPYLSIFATETIVLPDFKARKGLMYRAGHKLVEPAQYGLFVLQQT